jgi:hypothetical protein
MSKKFYKQEFHYVEPTSYLLGLECNRKERYGQYIPIKLAIQSLFKNCSVCNQFMNPLPRKAGVLNDVVDGSVFSSNRFFSEMANALKILLDQDAFELVNPRVLPRKSINCWLFT